LTLLPYWPVILCTVASTGSATDDPLHGGFDKRSTERSTELTPKSQPPTTGEASPEGDGCPEDAVKFMQTIVPLPKANGWHPIPCGQGCYPRYLRSTQSSFSTLSFLNNLSRLINNALIDLNTLLAGYPLHGGFDRRSTERSTELTPKSHAEVSATDNRGSQP